MVPALVITIGDPATGGKVSTSPTATGTVTPKQQVTVDLWNTSTGIHYSPTSVTVGETGNWSAPFQNIPTGNNVYSIKAWITGTPTVYAQNNNITVQ
jgi:hypothetical protein